MRNLNITTAVIAIAMMTVASTTAFAQKRTVQNRPKTTQVRKPQVKAPAAQQTPQKREYEQLAYNAALETQANQGDAVAQVYIGRCYLEGLGVAKNEQKAQQFFRKAAEQGTADGCYWYSKSLPVGNEKTQWLNKALEMDQPDALKDKAWDFDMDVRVAGAAPKDPDGTKAFYYFKRAAELGQAEAQYYTAH